MRGSKGFLADLERSVVESGSLFELLNLVMALRQGVEALGHTRMLGAQNLLLDREGILRRLQRLRTVSLLGIEIREILERVSKIGAFLPFGLPKNGLGCLQGSLGGLIIPN